MSNTFDLTEAPVVAYAYYRDGDERVFILCLDCDDEYVVPPTREKANIRDKERYGNVVPHMYCDKCDKRVTG